MAAEERTTLLSRESDKVPQRIPLRERAKRRRQIASAVKREKLTTRQAAQKFGVSVEYVRYACGQNGVRPLAAPSAQAGRFEILADLAEGKPGWQIAADRNISRQRVNQIKQDAERLGLLPKLRRIDVAELAELRAKVSERDAAIARRHAELAPQITADTDQTSKAFAKCLRHYRLAAELSQADAAALAGMCAATWNRYESGYRNNPQLNEMVAMAAALGVPVLELLRDLPTPLPRKRSG